MTSRKRVPRPAAVLLVDPADVLGAAGDEPDGARLQAMLRTVTAAAPAAAMFLVRSSSDAPALRRAPRAGRRGVCHVRSAFHTDLRRLAELRADRFAQILVVRPLADVAPEHLRKALHAAVTHDADLLTITGVPSDAAYVVSGRAIALLGLLGAIPGARTVPDAVSRLAAASPETELPFRIVQWTDADLTRPTAATNVSEPAAGDRHVTVGREVGAMAAMAAAARTPPVLVVLPSRYQTGAHFAWMALLDALDPGEVGFLVARGTRLAGALAARGFLVLAVDPAQARPGESMPAWESTLDALRPAVVHVDGAECVPYMVAARRRGSRVVQHVRLAVVDRFAPGFAHADMIVAVSPFLRDEIAARVGTGRVEYVPDGVEVPDAVHVAWPPASPRPVRCLCVGRVEPAKDTLRVIAIVRALAVHLACELRLIGPCGNDPAYADEVVTQLRALPDGVRGTWQPFSYPLADAYAWADVVLVASRSEALGMVGIEALAAGRLLVAQRSTGYQTIVDATAHEGLLFERDDTAAAIASRVMLALGRYAQVSTAARAKARTAFEAHRTAERLRAIWTSLL